MIVELHVDGAVGELVLNRPEKLNAMTSGMVAQLHQQITAAEEQGVRALLVRGEGRAFCAGRDLAGATAGEDAQAILDGVFNPLVERMAAFPAPTIAAVHGACLGTGLGLALACDLLYAAQDAKIGSPFGRGVAPRAPRTTAKGSPPSRRSGRRPSSAGRAT